MGARRVWTKADRRELRKLYPKMLTKDVAAHFGFSICSINAQASLMGLHKDPDFVLATNQKLGARLAQDPAAKANRFQKGHAGGFVSEEARAAFLEAGKRTRFAKGTTPPNHRERWSTRLCDGYEYTKIWEVRPPGGDWRDLWKLTHWYLWTLYFGPVPEGCCVGFLNKDRKDIRIDNLELISQAENMQRNTIHARYTGDLKRAIYAVITLKSVITKKEKKHGKENEHQGPAGSPVRDDRGGEGRLDGAGQGQGDSGHRPRHRRVG